jgi:hypothetical protein
MQRARGGGVNTGPGRKHTQDVECKASSTCTGTLDASPCAVSMHTVISSAFGMERGKVFYGPTDWLRSRDLMTHYDYAPDSSLGLDD